MPAATSVASQEERRQQGVQDLEAPPPSEVLRQKGPTPSAIFGLVYGSLSGCD